MSLKIALLIQERDILPRFLFLAATPLHGVVVQESFLDLRGDFPWSTEGCLDKNKEMAVVNFFLFADDII